MMRRSLLGLAVLVTLALLLRQYDIYAGWHAIHANEFADGGCEAFHVMRGMEQDPNTDPANAGLVSRCAALAGGTLWSTTQAGDPLRFDRPALVTLRVDVIDMQHYSNYPTLLLQFPYPPVAVEPSARWRVWGTAARLPKADALALAARWQPTWAVRFAEWSLGRGKGESWLGGVVIGDARYCANTERDVQRNEDLCVMNFTDLQGKPAVLQLPLSRLLEWRLELVDLCRFGGVERRWDNFLTRRWFGPVEYADRGCSAF